MGDGWGFWEGRLIDAVGIGGKGWMGEEGWEVDEGRWMRSGEGFLGAGLEVGKSCYFH